MNDRFSEALLDEIRAAVPITDVVGQYVAWDHGKSNYGRGDMWACCPFHGESTPSFHAEAQEGRYHCFGCGVSGDHFEFLMANDGRNFPEAVAAVAEMAGIALPTSQEPAKPARAPEQPRQEKARPQPSAAEGQRKLVKTYDYTDRDGNLVYQVCRFQIEMPDGSFAKNKNGIGTWKTFLQRRPANIGDGSWVWGLSAGDFMRPGPGKDWSAYDEKKRADWPNAEIRTFPEGIEHTVYRLPAVEIAIAEGKTILVVEGEKDADTAVALGYSGTTNSSGSKHWTAAHAACFGDADVVICLDNDEAGDRADKVAKSLKGIARRIRVLDFAKIVEGFDHKGDITDWVERYAGTSAKLAEIMHGLSDWRPRPPVSKFGGKMVHEIASTPIAYDWLVKGLIERGGVFVVAGEQQAGKSFFVIDLGMKIARGLDYCGRKVRQGLVIHHAGEDYRGVQMRVEGYRRDAGVEAEELPYLVTGEGEQKLNLMSDESVDAFIAECQQWETYFNMKLELVTIDTLSAGAEDLDEINGAEVGKVLGRINRVSARLQTAVAVVHHLNAGGQRVRGSTKFTANVAQVIEVRQMTKFQTNRNMPVEVIKDSDGRVVRQAILEKNKNGPNKIKWRFVLRQVQLDQDADGFQMTTCVCVPPSSEVAEGDPKEKLSRDQRLVLDALKVAIEDDGMPMPSGVRVGPQIKLATTEKAFVAAVRKVWPFKADETEHEARTKELTDAMRRNVTALINASYMGRDNDKGIVWDLKKDSRPRRETKPAEPPPPLPADVRDALNEGVPF